MPLIERDDALEDYHLVLDYLVDAGGFVSQIGLLKAITGVADDDYVDRVQLLLSLKPDRDKVEKLMEELMENPSRNPGLAEHLADYLNQLDAEPGEPDERQGH